jgi:XapX domain-containing protein
MIFAAVFLVGLVVGLIYVAIKVNAPAPPLVALFGLLGMWLSPHLLGMI